MLWVVRDFFFFFKGVYINLGWSFAAPCPEFDAQLLRCHGHTRRVGGSRIDSQRGTDPPFHPPLCPKSHLFEHRAAAELSLEVSLLCHLVARGKLRGAGGWHCGWAWGKEPGLSALPTCPHRRLLLPTSGKRKEKGKGGKKSTPSPRSPSQASPRGCGCIPEQRERGDTPLAKPPVFQLGFSSF